jgi:glucokinase
VKIYSDHRVVLTLDAGGTNFRFSAMRGGVAVTDTIVLSSNGNDLEGCLKNIVEGFKQVKSKCPAAPVAISFAFPGPADYPNGIIGDLGNLPAFRGGIALGPMLAEKFGIPVFINNDGDLFTYGEAIAGLLPHINDLLANAGSPKQFKNLIGMTLGTGLGGGIVRAGELFIGDNSMAGEVWLLRNKFDTKMNAEEGACIRAVRRVYAQQAGIPIQSAPDPKIIAQIARDEKSPNQDAAIEAYRRLGEVVGDALGQVLAMVDGLAVIGGGISGAHQLFLPALVAELNGYYQQPNGKKLRRLASTVFNLEDAEQLGMFLKGEAREIAIPGSARKISYDPLPRLAVGISRLGTSEAVAIGAYAFALRKLDSQIVEAPNLPTGGVGIQLQPLHDLSHKRDESMSKMQS